MCEPQGAAALWTLGCCRDYPLLIPTEQTAEKSLNNDLIPSFPGEAKD